jgi:hypothetical protein
MPEKKALKMRVITIRSKLFNSLNCYYKFFSPFSINLCPQQAYFPQNGEGFNQRGR